MSLIIPKPGETLMDLAIRCDAVYICPKEGSVRKGPLVIYAGEDDQGRNFVGDIYFNFRKVEPHPRAVMAFAQAACAKLEQEGLLNTFDTVCGIPQGGRTFGQMLALIADKRSVYADKKPKPTEKGKKQKYDWDLSEFEFEPGERVALAEDVFNNFQNTDNTLAAIAATGVSVSLLVGALNRSSLYDRIYTPKKSPFAGVQLPVVASICEPYPEYNQDHPDVVEDIAAGNLERQVKKNWSSLRAVMKN